MILWGTLYFPWKLIQNVAWYLSCRSMFEVLTNDPTILLQPCLHIDLSVILCMAEAPILCWGRGELYFLAKIDNSRIHLYEMAEKVIFINPFCWQGCRGVSTVEKCGQCLPIMPTLKDVLYSILGQNAFAWSRQCWLWLQYLWSIKDTC